MRKFTVHQFNGLFPTEDACLDFLRDTIYPDGIRCRKCDKITRHHRLTRRKAYSCQACGTHVYPLAGTVFAKSRTPLKSWFYAMYIMSSTRCGVSAKQLERELGVTYKTAWRMFKQIRSLLAEPDSLLEGTVEADEAFFGGKDKWKHASKRPHIGRGPVSKTTVFGMAQRRTEGVGGRVVARVVDGSSEAHLIPEVATRVLPASTIYTDEWRSYNSLQGIGYEHSRVAHAQKVYVDGDVHTNTIEGFWSLVKRGIGGVYHSVSAKHLQSYLDEYTFRYNHRDADESMYEVVNRSLRSVRYGNFGKYQPIG